MTDIAEYVPWECHSCGKSAQARPRTLIRCTCGATTWSEPSRLTRG